MRKTKRLLALLLCLALAFTASQALAAGFGADADEWTVTLDYNDGASRNGTLYVTKGQSVTLPTTAMRKGYAFAGWTGADGSAVPNPYTPDGDVTLTAVWDIGQCAVILRDSDSGEELGQFFVTYGAAPTDVQEPQKDGFAFRYWSLSPNGERVALDSYIVKNDLTLYAVWMEEGAKEFVITFKASAYSPDHTEDKVLYVEEGGQVKKADAPKSIEREGYKFEGWTEEVPPEGNEWTFDVYPAKNTPKEAKIPFKPKADTNFYAVWTIQQYMAIFNANYTDSEYKNGVVYSYKLLSNETVVPPEEAPQRADYAFDGWFTKALGGELADFDSGIKLQANTGFYAHWTHNPVETDTFHAEYTSFDPDQKYYGYSGSVQGTGCIVKDAGTVGTVLKDEYPANSKLPAGNGYYVSYQYERGDTLRFVINASQATTAKLMANLAVEVDSLDVGSTGDNATAIRVNGQDITYSLTLLRIFQEYEIATIDLNEGENIIEFVVDNDNTVMGGTYRAVGFMTDYIRLADCGATLTWSPIYDNLESN